jgi:transposase
VDATLELTHERVDDVPLLIGFLIKLKLPEILDRHYPAHPLHQGLSNGWLITVWIAYILSRADHRKSPVQAWTQKLQHTLETLIGQDIRPVEFSDDRLSLVLKRLDLDPAWESLEGGAIAPLPRVPRGIVWFFAYTGLQFRGKWT